MRNISDFENVPKRGWLLVGKGLKGNDVDFEVDACSDQETMERTNHLHDACVHVGFGYRMYSEPGGGDTIF